MKNNKAIYSQGFINIVELQKRIDNIQYRINQAQKVIRKRRNVEKVANISLSNLCAMISFLSPQAKSVIYETWVLNYFNLKKIPSSLNRGDGVSEVEEYYEIKISNNNFKNMINIRQIRLYQEVDYYIICYLDEEEIDNSKYFILNHRQMVEECEKTW